MKIIKVFETLLEMENDMTKQNILKFYSSKNRHYSKTDEFMKDHKQKSGGYIRVADTFMNKGNKWLVEEDKEFYKWLLEKKENCTLGNLESLQEINALNSLNDLDIFGINGKEEAEPNQKWHFFISYYAYKEYREYCKSIQINEKNQGKGKRKSNNVTRLKVTCPEFWLWMAEAAKDTEDNQEISEEDIEHLYKEAVEYRNTNNRKSWNTETTRIWGKIKNVIERCSN